MPTAIETRSTADPTQMQSALHPPAATALDAAHAATSDGPLDQAPSPSATPETAGTRAQHSSAHSPTETETTPGLSVSDAPVAADPTQTAPAAIIQPGPAEFDQPSESAGDVHPSSGAISTAQLAVRADHGSPRSGHPDPGPPITAHTGTSSNLDQVAADLAASAHVDSIASHLIIDTAGARPLAKMMRLAPRDALPPTARQSEAGDGRRSKVRSAGTEAQYVERVRSLWRASVEARTIDPQHPVEPTPAEVVQDLIDSAAGDSPRRSPASFSLYRSALLWHLAQHQHEHAAYRVAYEALATTKRPPGVQQQAGSKRKAAAKRCFVGNDLADLVNMLMEFNRRDYWGSYTQYWLQATIACGARPGEWIGTSWIDRNALKIQIPNSKRKAASSAPFERLAAAPGALSVYDLPDTEPDEDDDEDSDAAGIGPYRTVEVNRDEAVYIDLHLDAMESYIAKQLAQGAESRELAFARYYEMVRRTLRKACEVAFRGQKKYSLRSARSQFAANRKADHGLSAVAGDMGHGSERTTMGNYGARSRALPRLDAGFLTESMSGTQRDGSPDVALVNDQVGDT